MPIKYGSSFRAVPGYNVCVLDDEHNEIKNHSLGTLVIKLPMPPGFMRYLYNDNANKRFLGSYMDRFPGYYDTGDAGIIDEDGYVHIMSRTDDVINTAGHRLSCGAMEEILSEHHDVAEVAGLFVIFYNPAHTFFFTFKLFSSLILLKIKNNSFSGWHA